MKETLVKILIDGGTCSDFWARRNLGYKGYFLCKAERFLIADGAYPNGEQKWRVGQRGREFIEGKIKV